MLRQIPSEMLQITSVRDWSIPVPRWGRRNPPARAENGGFPHGPFNSAAVFLNVQSEHGILTLRKNATTLLNIVVADPKYPTAPYWTVLKLKTVAVSYRLR
jgi:hypothetical protein